MNVIEIKPEATPEAIRRFVTELSEVNELLAEKRKALKEVIESNEEIISLSEQIKNLKEQLKEVIETNAVITGYAAEYEDVVKDKKQLIKDAKNDGIPKAEIDIAIKMLKKDIDPEVTSKVFVNIADLIGNE